MKTSGTREEFHQHSYQAVNPMSFSNNWHGQYAIGRIVAQMLWGNQQLSDWI